jgi:hypothetical protein
MNGARGAGDRDAKKMINMKIFYRKFGAKFSTYCLKNSGRRSYENNVINVTKEISRGVIMMNKKEVSYIVSINQ